MLVYQLADVLALMLVSLLVSLLALMLEYHSVCLLTDMLASMLVVGVSINRSFT